MNNICYIFWFIAIFISIPQQIHFTERKLKKEFLLCLLCRIRVCGRSTLNNLFRNPKMFCNLVDLCFVKMPYSHDIYPTISVLYKETLVYFLFIGRSNNRIIIAFCMVIKHTHSGTLFKI